MLFNRNKKKAAKNGFQSRLDILNSVDIEALKAKVAPYTFTQIPHIKGFLEDVVKNPDLAEEIRITVEDIDLVFDVIGINAGHERLHPRELVTKYSASENRVAARFAVVVKAIEKQQTAGEEIGL